MKPTTIRNLTALQIFRVSRSWINFMCDCVPLHIRVCVTRGGGSGYASVCGKKIPENAKKLEHTTIQHDFMPNQDGSQRQMTIDNDRVESNHLCLSFDKIREYHTIIRAQNIMTEAFVAVRVIAYHTASVHLNPSECGSVAACQLNDVCSQVYLKLALAIKNFLQACGWLMANYCSSDRKAIGIR